MWSYGQTTRSSIDEANKHLQALMDRIAELEQMVREQTVAIAQKDENTHMQLKEISKEKDQEIKKLRRQFDESQHMLEKADDACREKDMVIGRLREKANVLSELVKFRPMMDKITHCLHNAAKLCVNDSDEEKNKSVKSYSPIQNHNHGFANHSVRKSGHSMKTAHSMINLSTNNEFYDEDATRNNRTSNREIKDRLAKSLLTGSTYDLRDADEDYMNSAVNYDVESPLHSGKELYL